jgi:hypothetical protein
MAADSALEDANSGVNGHTLREVARISIGGRQIRPSIIATGSLPAAAETVGESFPDMHMNAKVRTWRGYPGSSRLCCRSGEIGERDHNTFRISVVVFATVDGAACSSGTQQGLE